MNAVGPHTGRLPAVLALADGTLFSGFSLGASGQAVGEVVFNTAMTGYQEILTDPSYAEQIVTLTYPHIGNVGVNVNDCEAAKVWAAGLIIREPAPIVSNWRAEQSLAQYLQCENIVALAGIDTRRLTRVLRVSGAQHGCILAGESIDSGEALRHAQAFPGLQNKDLAKEVCTQEIKPWREGSLTLVGEKKSTPPEKFHVVVYDFGVKQNILRLLVDNGLRVTLVPAQTSASDVLALQPAGVLLSNGPGDPAACGYAINHIRQLLAKNVPLFGICLGFQLLALACGAKTVKMKFGHHGANHPVQDLETGRVFITSQNHSFAVDEHSVPDDLTITHRSLFDNTVQGIAHKNKPAIAFQGHPEASPGPHDIANMFRNFVELCQKELT